MIDRREREKDLDRASCSRDGGKTGEGYAAVNENYAKETRVQRNVEVMAHKPSLDLIAISS